MKIRIANPSDANAINLIYNQAVIAKHQTADLTPIPLVETEKWLANHNPEKYPVFVAELDGKVVGWISISPHRAGREALKYTSEVSYFIHQSHQKKGIGSALMDYVINHARDFEAKNLFAILLETNKGSIRLLEKFAFEKWGYLPRVAEIDGREVGQFYYGRRTYD
ncbi:GNAT family N-acetyltransferase [Flexithrix dorotheae]|uniref:GNAT family N-acetyltransferase n=1 Tax=Flexithrix dorotheae TaxID=70993 RepID=UPI000368EB57|nr:GNAT family N-acetyltransferase [Flexithrix dorotheae]